MILEFQGKVFRVISFNWEILQIMQLEETTYWYSLLYELKTNLSVCLEPDFPHFEESYIEQLPRPHHPKERVWQTSEKKQIIRNILIIWSSFIYKKLLISCLATF